MKKTTTKIIAAFMSLALLFGLSACGEVENGSKIYRVKFEVAFYDADGVATTYDIYAKLYYNNAPTTVNHIIDLVKSGYYNGVCISSATSSSCEFGAYTLGEDGKLVAKDQGSAIEGEFKLNGWTEQNISMQSGALILKRDSESDADDVSKYDTGKATIAVSFTSTAYNKNEYCVFGLLCNDDADEDNGDSETTMNERTSLGKMATIADYSSDDDGNTIYYCVKDTVKEKGSTEDSPKFDMWEGEYVSYLSHNDEMNYYYKKGELITADYLKTLTAAEIEALVLDDDEKDDFLSKKSNDTKNFQTIPYLKIIICSASIV